MTTPPTPNLLRRLWEAAAPLASNLPEEVPEIPKFRILRELGRGGVGVVYEAEDTDLRRRVAIKVLTESVQLSRTSSLRFEREARIMAGLSHPNLVTVHEVGESDGRPYLVMELVEGMPLNEWLGRKPELRARIDILEKAARGVGAAHAKGVIHRDLKPGNILVGSGGAPKVADFGLAHDSIGDESLTRTGMQVGTPLYMAPEQVQGGSLTPRTDVYALGAILYEMLTGSAPFPEPSLNALFHKILNEEPVAPRRRVPGLPVELEAVCLKAMEKDPSRRYSDAGVFADELQRFLDHRTVMARRSSAWGRMGQKIRRSPVRWGTGVLGVALAIALGAVVASRRPGPESRAVRISAAFHEMALGTLDAMRDLEDSWQGGEPKRPPAARILEVRAVGEKVAAHYPESKLPSAWTGLALLLGGRGSEGMAMLDAACEGTEGDPFPHFLAARARLASYAKLISVPMMVLTTDRSWLNSFEESAEMVALRKRALKDLEAGLRGEATGLSQGQVYFKYGRAALALGNREFARAAELLSELRDDPLLGDETAFLKGMALLFSGRADAAAETWESCLGRGWSRLYLLAAQARVLAAHYEQALVHLDRVEKVPAYRWLALTCRAWILTRRGELARAIETFGAVIVIAPNDSQAYELRGAVGLDLAQGKLDRGQDATAALEDAIRDFDAADRLNPRRAQTLFSRGQGRMLWAFSRPAASTEMAPALRAAEADYTAAIDVNPEAARPYFGRGVARSALAGSQDPELLRKGIDDLSESIRRDPGYQDAWFNRGRAYLTLGSDLAIADFDEVLRRNPREWQALSCRGLAHEYRSDRESALRDYKASLAINPNQPDIAEKIRTFSR